MVLSSFSTTDIDEVVGTSKSGLKWMQVYIFKDRELTKNIVSRAEQAGFRAIVVTVDQTGFGKAIKLKVNIPAHISRPIVGLRSPAGGIKNLSLNGKMLDPIVTWEDIDWIRGLTQLPVVIKGILTAEDAIEAVKHGVQGIIVSNHGGRLLDGTLATVCSAHSYSQTKNLTRQYFPSLVSSIV